MAAADLSVVIGAISQGFGGVYQDRPHFADYLTQLKRGPSGRWHPNAKGPVHDQIYVTARERAAEGV
jgi:hypothetical protein